ncbi:MAG: MATE family efflux transporter [Methanosphaera stadtmanae]|nr:MATE family efflux transporter [Methanosphaera stadtmanae]
MSEVVPKNKSQKNIDLIRGDPKVAIRKLSVPTMMSMILIMLYNLADSLWVAGLGADSLAALGFITPLFMILIGVGNGIGAGATSLIARAIGAKNKKLADNAAAHSVVFAVIISLIIPIILIPFLKDILLTMGAGNTYQYGLAYGNIVFLAMIVFILSGVLSALLRAEGDVNRSMYAIAITAILNIVIDPLFIYTLGWGIAGAALATVLSSLISVIVMAYWIWGKNDTYLKITKSNFEYKNSILKDISLVAIPNMTETVVFSIMIMCINAMLTMVGGTTEVAAFSAASRINQFAMIPLIGIGTAMLTVAGAAFGSKDYDKLSEAHSYSIVFSYIISIILCIIMFFGSDYISMIFTYTDQSAALSPLISNILRILCFFLLAIPAGMMSAMTFQGVGKGMTSLAITIFRALLIEIALAYILGIVLGLGVNGIYSGMVLAAVVGTIVSYGWCKLYLNRLKRNYYS